MTAIDLTRDQCTALADYLRQLVNRGMADGYDDIELLVLAQRALRNAAKAVGDSLKEQPNVIACDVPKSGTLEGGLRWAALRVRLPGPPARRRRPGSSGTPPTGWWPIAPVRGWAAWASWSGCAASPPLRCTVCASGRNIP